MAMPAQCSILRGRLPIAVFLPTRRLLTNLADSTQKYSSWKIMTLSIEQKKPAFDQVSSLSHLLVQIGDILDQMHRLCGVGFMLSFTAIRTECALRSHYLTIRWVERRNNFG